jgi:nucleotide-binding universal stress UspA family protein
METATIPRPDELVATGPVVVGIDDSDAARDAAALGHTLAEALKRDVLFTHVYPLHASPGEDWLGAPAWMPRTALVPARSVANGLRAFAAQENAVAVVVGSSRGSTFGRLLAGRTSERLLTNGSVPVAIAPAGYAEAGDRRIAEVGSAFDGSPNSRVALEWAAAVARSAEASLRVVGVHEPAPVASANFARVIREQQEKRLAIGAVEVGSGLAVEPELRDGATVDALVDASLTLDLLVLGTRGLGTLRGAVLGSVSSAVVRRAHSPVVVVPASRR